MQSFVKAVAALIVVIGLGLGIGWWATRSTGSTPPPPATNELVITAPSTGPLPLTTNRASGLRTQVNATPVIASPPTNAAALPVSVGAEWEDKLDEILGADDEDTNKVARLFALFPQLPPDGKEEVAQHLSNLVEDEHYAPLGELLKDATLPEDVLDVLLADLLNRPNADKLPMLLTIARNGDHAKAEEAKDLLELYLDEDYGSDWPRWETEMRKWLSENPD